jgi:flavin-dependent dehydrogenase
MRIDAVVIGGSLAGAACARELQRLGIEAVAFERDTFPRGKVCGGFLSPGAVDCLDHLDVLTAVRAAGAINVDHARIRSDDQEFEIPFPRPGLGISRNVLDATLANSAVQQGIAVHDIRKTDNGFDVQTSAGPVKAAVLIDAAGKLSRFTRRKTGQEFGVQYFEPEPRGSALDFWFFNDGYGGAVTVEGGQSNFCFLIKKDALSRYLSKPNRLVTGPIAYDRVPGDVIAIGDAAGMIDPFCGEGMHHALDSGITAARIVARGLRDGLPYDQIRQNYEVEWARRWSHKRWIGKSMRLGVSRPKLVRLAVGFNPRWFLERLWARIPT